MGVMPKLNLTPLLALVGVRQDISEDVQVTHTEQKLVQERDVANYQKNLLFNTISAMPDGVIILNIHRQVILTNEAAVKMIGLDGRVLQGRDIDGLIIFQDSLGRDVLKEVKSLVDKNIFVSEGINIIAQGKNQEKNFKLTQVTINHGLSPDLGFILLLEEDKPDEQIELLSLVAHELRTPLTSVIGYLEVLKEEVGTKLDDEQKQFFERAVSSSQQLAFLVENILNFSRIERGTYTVNSKAVDWQKLAAGVVQNYQLTAKQKGVKLEYISTSNLPNVFADDMRINEVLNNLINNALNYTQEGGQVKVSCQVADGYVVTAVSDNGSGIPKDAQAHLFTKFFRVTGPGQQSRKGTGLGLYLSKLIVNLHKGRIWVQSEEGKGSTFYFTLPIALPNTQINAGVDK